MKDSKANAAALMACCGIHVALTILLAVCLAFYDGLQHTIGILLVYMFSGWIIPVALWSIIKKILQRPTGSSKLNRSKFMGPVMVIVLGILFLLLSIFLPQSSITSITVNGETITQSNPVFVKELFQFRIEGAAMGFFFAVVGYFWLYVVGRK